MELDEEQSEIVVPSNKCHIHNIHQGTLQVEEAKARTGESPSEEEAKWDRSKAALLDIKEVLTCG